MKRLEHMKETLVSCVEAELCNIKEANTHELGAAVDMIKDLEEAIYYCTITKAMNEPKQKMMQDMGSQSQHQQQEPKYYPDTKYMKYSNGEMEGRAYYSGQGGGSNGNGSTSYYSGNGQNSGSSTRNYHDPMMRDPMEGRSPMYRKMYMESKKANGPDAAKNAKELEEYVHELTEDIMEMIEDASAEEKQMLRQKISLLANKIK